MLNFTEECPTLLYPTINEVNIKKGLDISEKSLNDNSYILKLIPKEMEITARYKKNHFSIKEGFSSTRKPFLINGKIDKITPKNNTVKSEKRA
jgi:hypothetical protein